MIPIITSKQTYGAARLFRFMAVDMMLFLPVFFLCLYLSLKNHPGIFSVRIRHN